MRCAARRPDLVRDVGRRRGDGVEVARLDAHHARRLGGPEPDREDRAECDRHLAEDVAGLALADDSLDAVDDLDDLDAPVDQAEQRPLGALLRRVFARGQRDVGRRACELGAVVLAELGEDGDAAGRRLP